MTQREAKSQSRIVLIVGRSLAIGAAWRMACDRLFAEGHLFVGFTQEPPPELLSDNQKAPEIYPRDVITDDYLEVAISQQGSSTFSDYVRSESYAQTHAVLLSMLSRRDTTGTFRLLERELVLRRLQLGIFTQLLRSTPTHVVFEETPHEAADYALYQIAQWMGMPTLFFQPSLIGPQVVARTSLFDVLTVDCPLDQADDNKQLRDAVKQVSLDALEKLKGGGGTTALDRQKKVDSDSRSRGALWRVARYRAQEVISGRDNEQTVLTGHTHLGMRVRKLAEVVLEWSLKRSLQAAIHQLPTTIDDSARPYALFALHYEPERTNMPEGLPFLSQIDAVLAARKLLPAEVLLVVKEHYSQQSSSLRGHVGRSAAVYRLFESVPGIQVLGVRANSSELIRNSVCVFTMTGKVGVEAAYSGVPSVHFGQPWWGEMPMTWHFSSVVDFRKVIEAPRVSIDKLDAWFDNQISRRLLVGLGGTSTTKYSDRKGRLPEGYEGLEADSLSSSISHFLGLSMVAGD